uniref:NitT/TauT family transport system ATP-binding protein/nitrate/nitrite transport system ATP-binding protein n=1 Tax=Candidatus Kentrum sp. DK TaxID=2126562 RepID=A0A450TJX5_9GAMM|nr:MAG: NitT/TauT family transport system ATP-binding protein/nitrate/nitrite transport system ATP-binding protein [Candidatus Kentron sp. DK]
MKIELDNLGFSFGSRPVLDRLSFTVPSNEVTAVLGVSGCGKSTLIKLLAGLERPTSGDIRYGSDGNDFPGNDDKSVVFQDSTLLPWKTVRQNIALARVEQALTVEQIAKEVGMLDALDLYPDELSGGMKQRVEFGRVLAQAPRLLFMDEPFSRLDVQFRDHLQGIFMHIHEMNRPTTVFVTHDIREAMKVASHIKVMTGSPVSNVVEYETGGQHLPTLMDEVERILQQDFDARRVM